MALADRKCTPCRADAAPLGPAEIAALTGETADWSVVADHHLARTFRFPDFVSALAFVNRIGAIAEAEGHHPDIMLAWGRVEVTIWTHQVNGLTESDFILAAKIDCEVSR